ncbi:hypothetical protein LSTR_LSTR001247 [Laodelphax striatellus]|uniref:BTB domain-containing protein n=1 Tax=Laodelphax striatellus TaxID=195883 RepID=A0A482XBK1_LAOST|nr:hypothetical protein LSTR_LSTR001247 [Laodelphax striatellus]
MCSNTSDDSYLLEKFAKRFLNSSNNGIDYDCEFLVGSQQVVVRGHKLVFAVTSDVFRAMFYGELREYKTVIVEDLDPEGFECMKQFIYTGEIKFSSAIQALLTYIAAGKYLIPLLEKVCCKYIEEKTHPSEVLEFYECCKGFNVSKFEELCSKIIRKKTDEVVVSDYFTTAKLETIEMILSSSSLKLKSELEVFDIFERWALAEASRNAIAVELMASSFETLKKHIRFLAMSGEQFVSRVAESSLLTQEEKLIIAMNMIKLNTKPMPEGLSPEQKQRQFIITPLKTPVVREMSQRQNFNPLSLT